MTTTMDSHMDLQSSTQSPPQEPAQANPAPDNPSPAPPTVPEATGTPRPPADTDVITAKAQKKQRDNELRALSRTFGNIHNVPIFTVWDKRQECSDSAVHRSLMAGICGNGRNGAYSIALSSLYKDDEDGGDVIIYTGTGGRERWSNSFPPKRLRLGPQTKDQSWDHPSNKALIVSFLTGNPVRVIRSWKCPSQYAPVNGYRYDGLYKVAAYWTAKGRNGKNICRCRLERLPDQPPIPLRPFTISASKRRRRERLVSESHITCGPSLSTNSCDTPDGTNFHIGPNQPNPSATTLAGSTGREYEASSNPPQQQAMPEISAGSDFNMDLDVKEDQQPPPPQRRATSNPDALPRYRWDLDKKQLVRVPASRPNPEDFDAAEGDEEECRGEDDASTLVPSEVDHVNVITERAETVYFSDRGNSPQHETPDQPRASGSGLGGDL